MELNIQDYIDEFIRAQDSGSEIGQCLALHDLREITINYEQSVPDILPILIAAVQESAFKQVQHVALDGLGIIAGRYEQYAPAILPVLTEAMQSGGSEADQCMVLNSLGDIACSHEQYVPVILPVLIAVAQAEGPEKVQHTALHGLGRIARYHENYTPEILQNIQQLLLRSLDADRNFQGRLMGLFEEFSQGQDGKAVCESDFHKNVKRAYQAPDAMALSMLLHAAGLPAPEAEEFLDGVGCHIIFLTCYGLALKVVNNDTVRNFERAQNNDLVLQPLKYVRLLNSAVMVLPGIEVAEEDKWDFINAEAQGTNICFGDQQKVNSGLLPVSWEINGKASRFPVVLDHGCIRNYENPLKPAFKQAAYNGIQERLYGDLKAQLQDAWPDNQLPDRDKMTAFFERCAVIVAKPKGDPERILIPGWAEMKKAGFAVSEKTQSSFQYDRRLQALNTMRSCAL